MENAPVVVGIMKCARPRRPCRGTQLPKPNVLQVNTPEHSDPAFGVKRRTPVHSPPAASLRAREISSHARFHGFPLRRDNSNRVLNSASPAPQEARPQLNPLPAPRRPPALRPRRVPQAVFEPALRRVLRAEERESPPPRLLSARFLSIHGSLRLTLVLPLPLPPQAGAHSHSRGARGRVRAHEAAHLPEQLNLVAGRRAVAAGVCWRPLGGRSRLGRSAGGGRRCGRRGGRGGGAGRRGAAR